jgi:hypothetical protein
MMAADPRAAEIQLAAPLSAARRSAATMKRTRRRSGGSNREAFADKFLGVTDDAFDQLEIEQPADVVGVL